MSKVEVKINFDQSKNFMYWMPKIEVRINFDSIKYLKFNLSTPILFFPETKIFVIH